MNFKNVINAMIAHNDKILDLVPFPFIRDIAICFENGIKGDRTANGWKLLKWDPDLENLYNAKLMGHHAAAMRATDPRERGEHLAAVAANACIIWYHAKGEGNENQPK
jgi:hypothetical protein